ncbi:MAG TPA: hypothetical protein VFN75_09695 [Pseudonocardiaceae bacterium]|nr:hypothetical protein [Pseudonocardiaceae bacterium]
MPEAEAGTVRIEDKGMIRPVEIRGRRIGFGTSRRPDSLAWAEIEVYKLDDGGYTAHRAGYSLTYHTADTRCLTRDGDQRGDEATVDDLPDDAEPCLRCRPEPPEYLPDGARIRYEFPRHTFDNCATPEDVEQRLTVFRSREGGQSVRYSKPVRDALRQAAQNDPAFRR